MKPLLITIDGPAGAGKSTVSRALAQVLGYAHVDTGALYRGIAYAAEQAGISAHDPDPEAVARVCEQVDLRFVPTTEGSRLFCDSQDISERIRTPQITRLASVLSALPAVRERLLGIQRALGARKKAVFEGRDMGTVVFPEADIKFFLTASLQARARRRHLEMGHGDLATVTAEMKKRDENDSQRQHAPLKPADDAITIDSTRLDPDQVVARMMDSIRKRF